MGKSFSIKQIKLPAKEKNKKRKESELKFLKEQSGGSNYLNKIDNLTVAEMERVRKYFVTNKIRFSEFKSRPLEYGNKKRKIKNPNMETQNGELYTVVYNRSFQDAVDKILKEIIIDRNDALRDMPFDSKQKKEIEDRQELYRRRNGAEMILEDFFHKGQQLQKTYTSSFRENFYISFIPFDVFSYLDKELHQNLKEFAAQYLGNNKVSVYYLIADRKKFKMVLSQDVDEKEIEKYPLKVIGQSCSIDAMLSEAHEKKKKPRNLEISGLDNLEKSVKLLSDHNVDFQGNSIGDDCYLLLIDEKGFKSCMRELKAEANDLF